MYIYWRSHLSYMRKFLRAIRRNCERRFEKMKTVWLSVCFLWTACFCLNFFNSFGNGKEGTIFFFIFGVCHVYSQALSLHRFITTKKPFYAQTMQNNNFDSLFLGVMFVFDTKVCFCCFISFLFDWNKYPKKKQQLFLRVCIVEY